MILALVIFIAPFNLTKSQAFQQPNRHSTLPVLVVLGIVQQKIYDLLKTRASQLLLCTKYKTLWHN